MRVAVFSRAVKHHSSGGMAVAAWNICRCMADVRHHVELFTTRTNTYTGTCEEKGVYCHFLGSTTPLKYESYFEIAAAAFAREHADKPFDAVVSISKAGKNVLDLPGRPPALFTSHGIGLDQGQGAANEAWVNGPTTGTPEVILDSYRSTYIKSAPDIHCTEVDFHRKWNAVAGVSLSACMDFATRLGCPRVYYLPNPVYDVDWTGKGVDRSVGGALKIGMAAGNLSAANKGIVAGLEMLANLPVKVEVHLFGGQPPTARSDKLQQLVRHGHLPQPEFLAQLAEMDVFFDPSLHHSGMNTTVCQSMALGVPVMAFPFGGATTAIHNGYTGWLVSPGDYAALEHALHEVSVRRRQYSHAAFVKAQAEFYPTEVGNMYTLALQNMVGNYPAPQLCEWRWK